MEDNKLEVDDLGNVELLDKYKKVSTSVQKWQFTKMMKMVRQCEIGYPIVSMDK